MRAFPIRLMRGLFRALVVLPLMFVTNCAEVSSSQYTVQRLSATYPALAGHYRGRLRPVSFRQLPGWVDDDHAAALAVFRRSCAVFSKRNTSRRRLSPHQRKLAYICDQLALQGRHMGQIKARLFIEAHFAPYLMRKTRSNRRLTGYYEPVIRGSRVRTAKYTIPIYQKPRDLVVLASRRLKRQARRQGLPRSLIAAKRVGNRLRPYYTRQQIEQGALRARGLELLYLADPVDAFFLHVQGSGVIEFPDGSRTRISYAAKNGYPYSSIGRYMIARGLIRRDQLGLEEVKSWLRTHPRQARRVLWQNRSFIFFRELPHVQKGEGPIGAQEVTLTPGRSLAIDRRYHKLGTMIYLDVPGLRDERNRTFRRLMVAQDAGSAIKGPERGDIYWGTGRRAGQVAGRTNYPGRFYILLPR